MRTLHASTLAELPKVHVRPALLVDAEFEDGWVYLWSGVGDLLYDGNTYTGVGDLGSVSPVTETDDTRANGITLSLSGIPAALVGSALGQSRQGKPVKVRFAMMDANWAIVGDPILAFDGLMDTVQVDSDGTGAAVTITAEHRLIGLKKPNERRWTHEEQQQDFAGDLGFIHVGKVSKNIVAFGGAPPTVWSTDGPIDRTLP